MLAAHGGSQQHALLLSTNQRLSRGHAWCVHQDLEQGDQERIIDAVAALLHLVFVDVNTSTSTERLHHGLTVAVHTTHVQTTGTHIHGHGATTQDAVIMQQDRGIDELVDRTDVGLGHLIEHLDVWQGRHRWRTSVDLVRGSHITTDGVWEARVTTFWGHQHAVLDRNVVGRIGLTACVGTGRVKVFARRNHMNKREGLGLTLRFLKRFHDALGQVLLTPLLCSLACGELELTVNRVDHALMILEEIGIAQVHAAIAQAHARLVVDEQ